MKSEEPLVLGNADRFPSVHLGRQWEKAWFRFIFDGLLHLLREEETKGMQSQN
jgi:hypothetical protein